MCSFLVLQSEIIIIEMSSHHSSLTLPGLGLLGGSNLEGEDDDTTQIIDRNGCMEAHSLSLLDTSTF
jgi:hypothetical protein